MSEDRWQKIWAVFHRAAELPVGEREEFVREASDGDLSLESELRELLAHHDVDDGFLEAPADLEIGEELTTGQRVGPYFLEEILGEGGMGVVWSARQTEPIERTVALKVMRLGMGSREVIQRFESERQTLARLDHSHIARVFDGGITDDGRPFFVMEKVDGEPITHYCDRRAWPIEPRVRLFHRVCLAVHHAHQKGIIHRDLKPSNVLVAEENGQPLPKIIDFGVAKAIGEDVIGEGDLTLDGRILGTPEYMSPEQADAGALVDVRSDIYSLGVMLHELLVGVAPLELPGDTPFSEFRRRIREETPSRPSDHPALGMEQLASQRSSTSTALRERLRGDLDWIVLKALEKEPARRYPSASELAADLQRSLDDLPVLAGPPSRVYRFRKFYRRHRAAVTAALAVTLTLALGVVTTSRMAVVASRQKAEAERAGREAVAARDEARREAETSEAVTSFLSEMLAAADPWGEGVTGDLAREVKVVDVLARAGERLDDRFAGNPLVAASLHETLGTTYLGLGLYQEAQGHLDEALALRTELLGPEHADTLTSAHDHATLLRRRGELDPALEALRATLEARERVLGEDDPETLSTRIDLAELLWELGRLDEAEASASAVLEDLRARFGDKDTRTAWAKNTLGGILNRKGESEQAAVLYEEAWQTNRELHGADHPKTLTSANNLAAALLALQRFDEAEAVLRDTSERLLQTLGARHPLTLQTQGNHAVTLYKLERFEEAESLYRQVLAGQREVLGEIHPLSLVTHNNLARLLMDKGEPEQARLEYASFMPRAAAALPPEHFNLALFRSGYGLCLTTLGRFAEAEDELLPAYRVLVEALGEGNARTRQTAGRLADLYTAWGKTGSASKYRRLAEETVAEQEL